MNTNRIRIGLLGLAGAVAGFTLQGCFAAQPLPECSVTITSAGLGLAPYVVLLTKVDSTGGGTCGAYKTMHVGLQRYRTKASGGDFTLAVRPSPVVDPYFGNVYSANTDDYNDCANEEDCQGADDLEASCVKELADGGYALNDGTIAGDGLAEDGGFGAMPEDGGDPFPVDPENTCGEVEDPVERRDSMDMDGKGLSAIGKMAQFPVNGVCKVSDFVGGVQNYAEETVTLVDGTDQTFPAITYKAEFTDFSVLSTAQVPGTAFTSKVKLTEGSCVANYTALGFWPEIGCKKDIDCDPNADLDAGRVFGSGASPSFKPKCDTDLKICVPTVDLTTLK